MSEEASPQHDGDVFEKRCQTDPQGVIKDLIAQTSRQGGEIHRLLGLTESVLEANEATFLLKLLASQPVTPSRDFFEEDMTEKLTKKLKALEKPPKEKKGRAKA